VYNFYFLVFSSSLLSFIELDSCGLVHNRVASTSAGFEAGLAPRAAVEVCQKAKKYARAIKAASIAGIDSSILELRHSTGIKYMDDF
jgi:hypothetical protein